jgi:HlyD family secretion protein
MKRVITILIIIAIAITAFLAVSWSRDQRSAAALSDLQTAVVSRGNLTATVGATGVVRPNQSTLLNWGTSGTVENVNVSNQDSVSPGTILASLERTSLPQNIVLAEAELISAQRALDDLLNSNSPQAHAKQALYQAQVAVIEADRALDKYDQEAYKEALDKARDEVIEKEDDLEQAKEDFEPYEDWDEDNEKRKSFQQALDDAQNAYDEALRTVDLLLLEKEQALANFAAAQAQLDDAQRHYERLKDGADPDDVAAQEARIAAAQTTLNLAKLESPIAGTITAVNISAGDRVSPGSPAFRIDDLSRLLVDVQVSEVDINRVRLDQSVNLTFDAVLGKEYHGVINKVSPIGNIVQGIVEFSVTVELTDADEDVKPGMTAAVNIIVEELNNVLMVPNQAVRVRDGQRVVYIQENNQLSPVAITLGASSETMSQVLNGGLQIGDVVALNPPQVFNTDGPPAFIRR